MKNGLENRIILGEKSSDIKGGGLGGGYYRNAQYLPLLFAITTHFNIFNSY